MISGAWQPTTTIRSSNPCKCSSCQWMSGLPPMGERLLGRLRPKRELTPEHDISTVRTDMGILHENPANLAGLVYYRRLAGKAGGRGKWSMADGQWQIRHRPWALDP